jgi:TetR/AcrR family transcriptional repressor of nem operon
LVRHQKLKELLIAMGLDLLTNQLVFATRLPKGEETRQRLVAAAEALILKQGYAGTSLDDVLSATGLTKGAFFHHFEGKADLARAVVEAYADGQHVLFREWSERADRLSDDALERLLIFLRLFEEHLDGRDDPFTGCIFASYTHEGAKFDDEIHRYIKEQLHKWQSLFLEKFKALVAVRRPVMPVKAEALAEMIMAIIEGGLIMANAYRDPQLLQRQLRQFRYYLDVLFKSAE